MEQAVEEPRAHRLALLRPGWLVLHVLVLAALVVMVRLGMWQWGRGEGTGGLRNYSYGLEWWAFTVLTVVGWTKFCLDETSGRRDGAPVEVEEPGRPAVPVQQPVPVEAVGAEPAEDPELAAWNARFADLARRDAEQRR